MEELSKYNIEPELSIEENDFQLWEKCKEMLMMAYNQMDSNIKKEILMLLLLLGTEGPIMAGPMEHDPQQSFDIEYLIFCNSLTKYTTQLESFRLLEADWDDEGAAAVDEMAIAHGLELVNKLPYEVLSANLEWGPTELGAVSLRLATAQGKLRAEIGDTNFSYFLKTAGKDSERHSFEPWEEQYINQLVDSLRRLV